MCGERLDEDCKTLDIFKTGPKNSNLTYATLLRDHLNLQPAEDDRKPRIIGEKCAIILVEWTAFKKKILETNNYLLKTFKVQNTQQRMEVAESANDSSEEEEEQSGIKSSEKVERERVRRKRPATDWKEPTSSRMTLRSHKICNLKDEAGPSGMCDRNKRSKK
ncbi:Hypothetical predicted protein [Cloeon dipterum]|uniref:Uncharacterized protein n=1 Tax=Cloeon dipterum TaxID=197152 RepID=A0A8S1D2K8_9INSE|nr:Hypothetical predicted protein [Cloeon dipterum]